jgi:folate-binding protein YgfZ
MASPGDALNRQGFAAIYRAVTSGAAVASLSNWTTIEVAGRDRAAFLHNLSTNDVRGLASGSGCEAFFADVKGRIVGHAFILAGDEAALVLTVPGQAERLTAHLERYIIREDVQLADKSADFEWLLALGPDSAGAVRRATGADPAQFPTNWSHSRRSRTDANVFVVRCDLPWCGGWLVAAPATSGPAWQERLAAHGAATCSDEVWHTVRIESGWPLLGVDFDGANLPQEVARNDQAINFRKGCYLGQETVARIDALGHVNRELRTLRFSGTEVPAIPFDVTSDGQSVGRLTSACWSPALAAPLGLAMVRRGHTAVGAALQCDGRSAVVVESPAVRRD